MLRLLVPIVLLLALVGVSVFSDNPAPRADLVFINSSDVNTLDPQRMSWMHDLRTARLLFQPLVQNDVLSDDFDIIPGVAESWEISDDARTYTFHLRHDAKWSNGEPVTAEDFRYSWRRAMLPDLVSDYVAMFMNIDGATEFYDWRLAQLDAFSDRDFANASERQQAAYDLWDETHAQFDALVGMQAPDPQTLVVRLSKPVPYFLDICAFGVFAPVYEPLVAQYERPDPQTGRLIRRPGWTQGGVLISNGPFILTRWRMKRDMRLEKNPYFWDRDNIAIDSIDIPSINDPNAGVLAYQTGAVDWIADVTAPYRGEMVAQSSNTSPSTPSRSSSSGLRGSTSSVSIACSRPIPAPTHTPSRPSGPTSTTSTASPSSPTGSPTRSLMPACAGPLPCASTSGPSPIRCADWASPSPAP